jgi:CRISPR-associated protein Cmr6
MSDSDLVPLMYRAQIEDRGKIQYAGGRGQQEEDQPASKWLNQWLKGCPPVPKAPDENVPKWKQKPPQTQVKIPQFGANVHTWEYTQSWRFVTNSGQDEGIIRPVIGAKGIPFYPGSSMKGAFLRACQQIAPDKLLDYCGGEVEEIIAGKTQKKTKPGVLRFHGGYPVDMSWGNTKRLLDLVHNQEERQVMRNENSSAKVQISLYQTKFKFGISRIKNNIHIHVDWNLVEKIWERALSDGIGSRTSAGYGRFEKIQDQNKIFLSSNKVLASVNLSGRGIFSTLLNGTTEFRPNMFKAALRGHTLRLLAGVTNDETTQRLTKKMWGGFLQCGEESGSIVGKFGVDFQVKDLAFEEHKYSSNGRRARPMPLYNLKSGILDIFAVQSCSEQEREFLTLLIKFSLLLGGFGKSWRRVHHGLFYQSYFKNNDKPMIGCHWLFSKPSESADYCITAPRGELDNIKTFLASIPDSVRNYFNLPSTNNHVNNWREVWHPQRVQVWGRIAEDKNDSQAVEWFHKDNFIKKTELTGIIGKPSKVSRIWHRMYPLYVKIDGKLIHKKNERGNYKYFELLTIFTPDDLPKAREFLNLLNRRDNDFIKLWGGD